MAALLVGLAVIAAAVARPHWAVVGLAALLPFNGLATQLLGGSPSATAVGALKDVVLLAVVLRAIVAPRVRRRPPGLLLFAIGAFQLSGLLAALQSPTLEQALYGWRNDFVPILLLPCLPAILKPEDADRVRLAMVTAAQLAGVVAVAAWTQGIPWLMRLGVLPPRAGERFPWDYFSAANPRPRAFSPYVAPNELAVGSAVVLALIMTNPGWSWRRRVILSVMPMTAVALSQSRSGWLGLLLLLICIAVWLGRRSGAGLSMVTGTVGGLALGIAAGAYLTHTQHVEVSFGGHARSLVEGVQTLSENWAGSGLGSVGPRAFRFTDEPILVESFVLLLGVEAGVLAMLAYLVALGALIHKLLGRKDLVAFGGVGVLLASSVNQLVLPSMQEGAVSYTVWLAAALAWVLSPPQGSEITPGSAHGRETIGGQPSQDPYAHMDITRPLRTDQPLVKQVS